MHEAIQTTTDSYGMKCENNWSNQRGRPEHCRISWKHCKCALLRFLILRRYWQIQCRKEEEEEEVASLDMQENLHSACDAMDVRAYRTRGCICETFLSLASDLLRVGPTNG